MDTERDEYFSPQDGTRDTEYEQWLDEINKRFPLEDYLTALDLYYRSFRDI